MVFKEVCVDGQVLNCSSGLVQSLRLEYEQSAVFVGHLERGSGLNALVGLHIGGRHRRLLRCIEHDRGVQVHISLSFVGLLVFRWALTLWPLAAQVACWIELWSRLSQFPLLRCLFGFRWTFAWLILWPIINDLVLLGSEFFVFESTWAMYLFLGSLCDSLGRVEGLDHFFLHDAEVCGVRSLTGPASCSYWQLQRLLALIELLIEKILLLEHQVEDVFLLPLFRSQLLNLVGQGLHNAA